MRESMKQLKFRSVFLSLIILINFNSFSQDTINHYKGSIIAGTNRSFIISLYQQEQVKVKILSLEGDGIIIKDKSGNTRKVDRSNIINIEEIPYGKVGNVGVGFGAPYGLLGFNLDLNLLPILSVTGGIGTTIFSGVGYNVGIKAYMRKLGSVWRPRASVYYGINGLYAEDFGDPDNKKYPGFTVGIGQIFLWQQQGFDLDLMYIVSSELWDEHGVPGSKIKIAIGYRYAF
jgi:hypothetical protein